MAIAMDHHIDKVGIVECLRRALERRFIKVPGRGHLRPGHPGDAAPIGNQSFTAPLIRDLTVYSNFINQLAESTPAELFVELPRAIDVRNRECYHFEFHVH